MPNTEATQRSSSMSSLAHPRGRRKSRSRRCWFGCLWLSRVSLLGSSASTSRSPEPDESVSIMDRITSTLNEKPLKMAHILNAAKHISSANSQERSVLFDCGIIHTLLELISETAISEANSGAATSRHGSGDTKRRGRRSSTTLLSHRGTGYGTGSTRSRWDIERTVEEKLAREEHLTWLLNVFNSYLVSWPVEENIKKQNRDDPHLHEPVIRLIADSSVISILEYNLRNDSFFDVSEHLEIYQSLLETAACMAACPGLVPLLVKPYHPSAKSIAKELIPRFKDNILSIQSKWGGTLEGADFRMTDFTHKVTFLSDFVVNAAREYESTLPPEQRIRTASQRRKSTASNRNPTENTADAVYRNVMKEYQLSTYRFIGEFGKIEVPYAFKKDARSTNPFSSNMRDRTKRIAKELASLSNSLPLNASNSIYVCYDESRCDIIKVLISGPDDTPYANGLFEFDIFFPIGYPFSPPKCAFLTTGAGNVRFNPNLYNDGKICLSILGTWEGRPEEKWNPYCSIMQVLVSIQGLIFVKDPYFNEPGFEKYQGTNKGDDYSRKYNLQIEHATLNYAIREQLRNPPPYFKEVAERHLWLKRDAIIRQAKVWLANMKADYFEEKYGKHKETVCFESSYCPSNQEYVVSSMIEELNAMKCPFSEEKKVEAEAEKGKDESKKSEGNYEEVREKDENLPGPSTSSN